MARRRRQQDNAVPDYPPPSAAQTRSALKSMNYADMPLGGPIAGPGPMAPIVPGDFRTQEMKDLNYADMPLGAPMARGGPVSVYKTSDPIHQQFGRTADSSLLAKRKR